MMITEFSINERRFVGPPTEQAILWPVWAVLFPLYHGARFSFSPIAKGRWTGARAPVLYRRTAHLERRTIFRYD
jgi:hypothetical protein